MGFSARREAGVESISALFQRKAAGSGGKERAAQTRLAAGDVPLSFVGSAVLVERSKPGKGCTFLAPVYPDSLP